MMLPRIASRLFGEPLMIDPRKAAAILAGIGGRIVEGGFVLDAIEAIDHVAFAQGRPSMGRVGDPLGAFIEQRGLADRLFHKVDNVAVIPLEGTLVHKGKWIGSNSGDTSYEGIQTQVNRARRDPSVKGVVFEIDSFGGEAAGAFDTADLIAQLSAEKPTLAILTDFALSAGYLMASAARQIVMPETGGAGSIGVMTMHVVMSAKLEKDGYRVTLISSGKHKVDGHPALALAADVLEKAQARVDMQRDLFAERVGRYRGPRLTKAAALATEADSFSGQAAAHAGLVDGIINPTEAFLAFVSAVNRGRPAS